MSRLWCQMVIEGLMASGIRELVVSPGSRSTPLLLAAIESELVTTSIVDERSAAFFALGRARASAEPIALLCTSGSAVSHYLPALLEARYAGHRVIALTADRPPNLQDCGANQTIRQRGILEAACGECVDLGLVDEGPRGLEGARRRVYQHCATATGPVHFNLPFRKPLEPDAASELPDGLRPLAPIVPPRPVTDMAATMDLIERCKAAARPLIVCGPSTNALLGDALVGLAEAWGCPLLCEATSGVRFTGSELSGRMDTFPHLLRAGLPNELQPDFVIAFGDAPVSTPLLRWQESAPCDSVQICETRYVNPGDMHNAVLFADELELASTLSLSLGESDEVAAFTTAWRAADARAWDAVRDALPSSSEASAVRALIDALPEHCQLTLGNSLPIRAVDELCPGSHSALRVLHQRGTSGIDGLVAGAIGSTSDDASVLLLGDVSFQHDLSSLALAPLLRAPLLIAVLDNGGGRIFDHLPAAQLGLSDDNWALWRTPTSDALWQMARAGAPHYIECSATDELSGIVDEALSREGLTVLRIRCESGSMLAFQEAVRESLS